VGVNQRRMPSGQSPARGAARPGSTGARPRGPAGRLWSRGTDAPPRRPGRFAAAEPPAGERGSAPTGGLRGGRPARRTRAPRGPIRVSGRVAALGVILLALMLAYAYPLQVYFAQQAEIAQLEADQRAQREHIQQLSDEVRRWNEDDEYIKDQALQRFLLTEVGDRVYVVGVDTAPADGAGEAAPPPPWYEQLWTSVQTADDPPAP
jgi:cell division protein FtsB